MPSIPTLGYELRIACMRITRYVRYNTAALPPHWFTVLAIASEGPVTAAEIAGREQVSAPSMHRTIRELTERGWIERIPDPGDGRRLIIKLTEEGREVLTQTRKQRDAWIAKQVAECTPEERQTLEKATTILNRFIEAT